MSTRTTIYRYHSLIIFFLLIPLICLAAPKTKTIKKNVGDTPELSTYNEADLKINPSKITSAKALYKKLSQAKKSEFESFDEYETRIKKDTAKYFDKAYIFKPKKIEAQYDAESKRLEIVVNKVNFNTNITSKPTHAFITEMTLTNGTPYKAQNPFGAQFVVKKGYLEAFGVILIDKDDLLFKSEPRDLKSDGIRVYDSFIDIKLSMLPGEAQLLKNDLYVLFVGKLSDTKTFDDYFHLKPTFKNPVDIENKSYYCLIDWEQIIVYRGSDGNIIRRFKN